MVRKLIARETGFNISLTLVILVSLIIMTCLPAPVYAAASLTMNPFSGAVGSMVKISGKDFSGRLATIRWDDRIVASNISVSEIGEFDYNLTIPSAPRGIHKLHISDDSNWAASTADTEFTVVPSVSILPTVAKEYSDITITGYGFSPNESGIKITWDDNVIVNAPLTADRNGMWSAIIPIPKTTKGEHLIGAFSSATNASEIGKIKFVVAPYVKVTPLSGTVGTQLKIYGWGFRGNEDGLSITWDKELVQYNIRAEPDGSMIVDGSKVPFLSSAYTGDTRESFFIPPTTQGKHVLGVYGSSFTPIGVLNDTTIEVIPDIKLESIPHIEGTQVTINGTGFAGNETITLTIDKANKRITAKADKVGSFSATIVISPSKFKELDVAATGDKGNSTHAALNISSNSSQTIPTDVEFRLLSPPPGTMLATFDSVGDVLVGTFNYLVGVFDYLKGAQGKIKNSPKLTLIWKTSDDFTNISYVLQIARDSKFSSLALDKKISTNSEYTLSENETLSRNHYYWRVKSVTSTGQESQWSQASEFDIISMSTTVAILSILAIVLIIIAIIIGIFMAVINLRR
jgi:hypothetical protein